MKLNIEISEKELIALSKVISSIQNILVKSPISSSKSKSSPNEFGFLPGFGIDLKYIGEDPRFDKTKIYQAEKKDWEMNDVVDLLIPGVGWVHRKDFKLAS